MKKSKLIIDYDYDFRLAGIVSSARSYKLAWEVNRALGIQLIRQPDLTVGFKGKPGVEKQFVYYSYDGVINRLKLFKNKPMDYEQGKYFLVPEFPRFDFIFLTASENPEYHTMTIQLLKEIGSIELVTPLSMENLRSKENFIF
ncbi:MAG: IPExxxVDY family protein [Cyclobacteriaceae bacterium]|jgi:hypothetical protein|nr:IPExxxVDY family protein [Cyclobacteriaceae bacterium]